MISSLFYCFHEGAMFMVLTSKSTGIPDILHILKRFETRSLIGNFSEMEDYPFPINKKCPWLVTINNQIIVPELQYHWHPRHTPDPKND